MTTILGVLPYLVSAWVFGVGLWGVTTSRNLVHMVVSLAVLQTSTYMLLLGVGHVRFGMAPVFYDAPPGVRASDPIVQALMLTDVVVEATVIALLLSFAVKAFERGRTLDPARLAAMRG